MDPLTPLASLGLPLPQVAGLAAIGLWWLYRRHYFTAVAFFGAGVLWLALCATPAFAGWLQRGLENQYPPQPAATYPTADAIVVLSGGSLPRLSDDSSDEKATAQTTRVGFALQLFREARAPVILAAGGNGGARQMAHLLEQQGVPVTSLLTENTSQNTHQNALYSARILKRKKLQRILLVTSSLHMPRAAASFKRQGLTVIAAPAFNPKPSSHEADWWRPRRAMLTLSGHCLHEYLGLWVYKLLGWA